MSGLTYVKARAAPGRQTGAGHRPGQSDQMLNPELILIKVRGPRLWSVGRMTDLPRLMLRLFLLLALAILGPGTDAQAMAPHAPTMMVICGESGATTVWLDASGQPVQPPDCGTCPDCLSAAATPDLPAVFLFSAPQLRAPARVWMPEPAQPLAVAHLRPVPRGPPAPAPMAVGPNDAVRSFRATAPAPLEFGQVRRGQSVTDRRATTEDAR